MNVIKVLIGLGFVAVLSLGAAYAGEYKTLYMARSDIANSVPADAFAQDEVVLERVSGEQLYFDVGLALTPEDQARGLMFRTEMEDHQGMLFVFGDVAMRSFWMKNTLIPLDLLFVGADGEIHHIHHNATPQDMTGLTSLYPSKAVLEINGGLSDRLGIKEGDRLLHDAFRNVHSQSAP